MGKCMSLVPGNCKGANRLVVVYCSWLIVGKIVEKCGISKSHHDFNE